MMTITMPRSRSIESTRERDVLDGSDVPAHGSGKSSRLVTCGEMVVAMTTPYGLFAGFCRTLRSRARESPQAQLKFEKHLFKISDSWMGSNSENPKCPFLKVETSWKCNLTQAKWGRSPRVVPCRHMTGR